MHESSLCIMEYQNFLSHYNILSMIFELMAVGIFFSIPITILCHTNEELIQLCLSNISHTFEILVPKAFECILTRHGLGGVREKLTSQCVNTMATLQKWFLLLSMLYFIVVTLMIFVKFFQMVFILCIPKLKR